MTEVYLVCRSQEGNADWYGDFNYYDNPLEKYISCKKQCETEILRGSGHGFGVPGVKVKTTKEFIEMMGWEEDLKYQITEEQYNNY
jgi:hypothetical protein